MLTTALNLSIINLKYLLMPKMVSWIIFYEIVKLN